LNNLSFRHVRTLGNLITIEIKRNEKKLANGSKKELHYNLRDLGAIRGEEFDGQSGKSLVSNGLQRGQTQSK
jgi:hypothetical protein